MSQRPPNFIDGKGLVLEATDIVRLIGETVQLKRAGRRYTGLCPFHNEKSPSFSVDPSKQFFYCFGCKKGGNAIDFIIERDRCEFRDALQTLADWAGVELPKFEKSPEQADKRKRLLDAHSAAAELYRRWLLDPSVGKAGLAYLRERGFADETIKQFGLGYAPAEWENLARAGLLRKFPAPLLEEGGLVKRRERGDGFYDVFRERVLFPIRDEQGRPIAFGGRILPGSDHPAKYLNSPETPLFSKGRVLFGLDLAKKRIVETRTAIVFEGYMDAAMAHQYGVTNAVAVLGTALTPEHAQTLRRLADRIVLLFDADAAGGLAARRSVELFLQEPVEIAVAELPEGVDPDEFLRAEGRDAFERRIAEAVDALEFQWRQMRRQYKADSSVTGQQKAVQAYLEVLAEARGAGPVDPMRWGAVVARVSRLLGTRPDELNRHFSQSASQVRRPGAQAAAERDPGQGAARRRSNWQKDERGRWRRAEPQYAGPRRRDVSAPPPESARSRAEGHLLGALFNDPHLWHQVQEHVALDDFSDRRYRWLAERFWEHLRNEGEPTFAEWLDVLVVVTEGRTEAAAKAKAACIQLAEHAEALGEPRQVAAEAVQYLLGQRGGAELDELLATMRRGSDTGGDSTASAKEMDLLRALEQKVREKAAGKPLDKHAGPAR